MDKILKFSIAILLSVCTLNTNMALAQQNKVKVIAHRGYWDTKGSAQNSIKALQKAHEIGVYGCEFDVNMTSDGVLVVCHGPKVGDIEDIQKATFAQAMKIKLENGEKLPTLEEYLAAAKKGFKVKDASGASKLSKIHLVLEIKPSAKEIEEETLTKAIAMVKKMKLENRITIISFSLYVCARAAQLLPNVPIQYLMGDMSPKELQPLGITGIDYHSSILLLNEDMIKEAHALGMEVNAWTIDDMEKADALIKLGVDYITTNKPVEVGAL